MIDVIAIIVTYNRKELLSECLDAILKQTYPVDKIIIVDNNSNDGTEELVLKKYNNGRIDYLRLPQNIGGAGGFYEGFKAAMKYEAKWFWIMDDDTIAYNDTLEMFKKDLENIRDKKISFLASSVYGPNNEAMNVPIIDSSKSNSGYPDWYFSLDKGLVKIKEATFVSLLINVEAVKSCGLPLKEYFIWGDDTEYTLRLSNKFGVAFLSGNSRVLHKRKVAKAISIFEEENITRISFFYYMVRNNLVNKKLYFNKPILFKELLYWEITALKVLFKTNIKFRFKKFKVLQKGINDFILAKYKKFI